MMRFAPFVLLAGLAACAPWPEVGGPTRGGGDGWPSLLPMERVSEVSEAPPATDAEAQRLAARAAALRGRATILRSDPSDMEALRERLRNR